MDIEDWRRRIDEIDLKLVELVNQRAQAAREIGKLKRVLDLPVYEPDRERLIFENISGANAGPLPSSELHRIFERIIDVMRSLQRADAVGHNDKAQGAERSNP
jgi:chorismate mutase-like protein